MRGAELLVQINFAVALAGLITMVVYFVIRKHSIIFWLGLVFFVCGFIATLATGIMA